MSRIQSFSSMKLDTITNVLSVLNTFFKKKRSATVFLELDKVIDTP